MWKENYLQLVFHVCDELTPLLVAGNLKRIVGSDWAL